MRRQIRDGTVTLPHIQTVRKGGKAYRYARPPNGPRVRLPDLPMDHPDFLVAYADAMRTKPKAVRAQAGTIAAMIEAFRRSETWLALSPGYRKAMAIHLEAISERAADARAGHLRADHIRADVEPLPPNVAGSRLKAWRLACSFGKANNLMPTDPSEGIRRKKVAKTDGFLPWTRDHIDAYRARWPIGTVARLCMEIVFWTGARIGDAVLIGEGMVGRDGVLAFKQSKTGDYAYVPWTCALPAHAVREDRDMMHAALAARTTRHMTFLATREGRTRSDKAIGNVISESAALAGFDRSAHGLRKSRAISLAEGGATPHQIAAWTGHATLREVQRYTEQMDRRNAVRGTEQGRTLETGPRPCENRREITQPHQILGGWDGDPGWSSIFVE